MTSDYFGEGGVFSQACKKYRSRSLPLAVMAHASELGRSTIAYCLGYAFADALKDRSMTISDEDLIKIADGKISYGDPKEFLNGFAFHESLVTSHQSPVTKDGL